jgi:hypothetical protein
VLQEHVKDKDLNELSASLTTALSSLEETATKKTLGLNLLELEKMIQDDRDDESDEDDSVSTSDEEDDESSEKETGCISNDEIDESREQRHKVGIWWPSSSVLLDIEIGTQDGLLMNGSAR